MNPRRRTQPAARPSYAVKRALLAGAALMILWPTMAQAQATAATNAFEQSPLGREQRGQILNDTGLPKAERPKSTAPVNTDGLKPGELYMEADQLVRDDKNGITTAEGNVEIRYED